MFYLSYIILLLASQTFFTSTYNQKYVLLYYKSFKIIIKSPWINWFSINLRFHLISKKNTLTNGCKMSFINVINKSYWCKSIFIISDLLIIKFCKLNCNLLWFWLNYIFQVKFMVYGIEIIFVNWTLVPHYPLQFLHEQFTLLYKHVYLHNSSALW